MDIKSRYEEYYHSLVEQYAAALTSEYPAAAYRHIPQLFLPAWGKNYERSLVKTAFIGLETYGWGDSCDFLQQIGRRSWSEVFNVSEFQNLDYVKWTNGHRYTFWGFIMYFLGALYGVKNWELLKHKEHANILNDFVWGNATSIERWGNCDPKKVDFNAWNIAKRESLVFDDYQHIKKLFDPQVVVMTCGKREGQNYLRNTDKKLVWSRNNVQLYKTEGSLIFHMPHPNNMKFNCGADFYANVIREGLKENGLFAPIKEFADIDADAENILKNLVTQLKVVNVTTKEAVGLIATALRKQEARISVRMLCRILNQAGYRTTYGEEYSGGRGSYKMIADTWRYYHDVLKNSVIAEEIALSFTKPNGEYAYWDY